MTPRCHPEVLRRIWRRTPIHSGSAAYLTMTIAALSTPAKPTLTLFVPVDPVILDAARRGDRKARGVLLSQLQDIWFRFAMAILHDRELAADATQETALRFLKQLPTFKGQSELRTWSLGIALNVTRELKRKKQFTSDPDDLPPTIDPHDDAPASLDLLEQRDKVRAILNQLSERQREVVVLRFFEDLSTDETAKAMNCAPGTVKATLFQALRILKDRMAAPS